MSYTVQGQSIGIIWGGSITDVSHSNTAMGVNASSENFSTEFDNELELKNMVGDTYAVVYSGEREKLELTLFPAKSNPSQYGPNVGETVTVTSTDSDVAGAWICGSSSRAAKVDGITEFSVSLYRPKKMKDDGTINSEA